jgi:hypothetical protein
VWPSGPMPRRMRSNRGKATEFFPANALCNDVMDMSVGRAGDLIGEGVRDELLFVIVGYLFRVVEKGDVDGVDVFWRNGNFGEEVLLNRGIV